MIISENRETVEFKTTSPFFEKERDGQKCNTVRIFTNEIEETRFINSMFGLLTVVITNPETKENFERAITDITFAELNGLRIYIISWMHRVSEP